MGWQYKDSAHDSISDVVASLNKTLGNLTSDEQATAKIILSDQKDGDARGAIYWYTESISYPPPVDSWFWALMGDNSKNDYAELYKFIEQRLNALSFAQALYTHISMSNRKKGFAVVSMWYPLPVGS